MYRKSAALIFLLSLSLGPRALGQATPIYKDPKAPLETRVDDLFNRLTQDEKLGLLTGTGFTTQAIPRLGVPRMGMADAGQGVRGGTGGTQGPATLFPSGVTMASSWDRGLLHSIGQAIGSEALNKGEGAHVLLGPDINIHRSPLGGRDGESFTEDPYLDAQLAVNYIEGMQSTGCAACAKHYVCNNEEVDRGSVNVKVDERTLREIYLPAFEAAVKQAHVWTIMSAYNKINGYHATANKYLLTEVLKKCWGFDGLVMSDWGAVHETVGVVNAGNDLEMPGPGPFLTHDKLQAALQAGQIKQSSIDDSVKRILRTVIRVGLLDGPQTPDHSIVNSPAHQKLALEGAEKGIILLKNEGNVLPLDDKTIKSIAVIGPRAAGLQMGAYGSPYVQPFFSINPLQGITQRAGDGITINYVKGVDIAGGNGQPVPASAFTPAPGGGNAANGLLGEYFTNANLQGNPAVRRVDSHIDMNWTTATPAPGVARTNFSVRWTGKLTAPTTGDYTLEVVADDGCRLYLDGKAILDYWAADNGTPRIAKVSMTAGQTYDIRLEYFQAGGDAFIHFNWQPPGKAVFPEAIAAAAKSDVAIVFVGSSNEGEGTDRASMALPGEQDALIEAVAAANKKTIVVLNNGTPCDLTPWLNQVPGLVEAWFPGEEGGAAIASILFGDVDPSGKLPDTLGARREDYPDTGHFPGVNGTVDYAEGIYVGYRHFDKAGIKPLFPFGYGLSYTTFRYSNLKLSSPRIAPDGTVTASVDITNTGTREGAEVVELYVHDPTPKIDRPIRELKGFDKVDLKPGATKTVSIQLAPRAFAYCDVPGKQWKADAGTYDIEIGASSRDIRLTAPVRLTADYTDPIPFMGVQDAPPVPGNDLAQGKKVTASSVQPGNDAANAVDGDPGTRWGSAFSDPQWIAVDLVKPVSINSVVLTWEDAYASAYSIQVSSDGQNWTDVYKTTNGAGGVDTIKFQPVTARWVRMYGAKRGTKFGYSLFSFQVYGPKG